MLKNISLKLWAFTKNAYFIFFDVCLIIFAFTILLFKREVFFDKSIIYVTASDENYFKRSLNLIKSINKFDPKQKIVFYDLGLNEIQQKTLLEFSNLTIKSLILKNIPNLFLKGEIITKNLVNMAGKELFLKLN